MNPIFKKIHPRQSIISVAFEQATKTTIVYRNWVDSSNGQAFIFKRYNGEENVEIVMSDINIVLLNLTGWHYSFIESIKDVLKKKIYKVRW